MNIYELMKKLADPMLLIRLSFWVKAFGSLPEEFLTKGRDCGVFGVIHQSIDNKLTTLAQLPVGELHPEKLWKYLNIATKSKPKMLLENPGHGLSFQSRTDDPDDGKWGGAFRLDLDDGSKVIFSFSGLTEAGDFVVGTMAAMNINLLSIAKAREWAEECGATALLDFYLQHFCFWSIAID